MRFKLTWTVLLATCLTACATPSPGPAPRQISPSLLAPCQPHLQRQLTTFGDALRDYSEALVELRECAASKQALAEAVRR